MNYRYAEGDIVAVREDGGPLTGRQVVVRGRLQVGREACYHCHILGMPRHDARVMESRIRCKVSEMEEPPEKMVTFRKLDAEDDAPTINDIARKAAAEAGEAEATDGEIASPGAAEAAHLSVAARALVIADYAEEPGHTREGTAEYFGIKAPNVYRYLKFAACDEDLVAAAVAGDITMTEAIRQQERRAAGVVELDPAAWASLWKRAAKRNRLRLRMLPAAAYAAIQAACDERDLCVGQLGQAVANRKELRAQLEAADETIRAQARELETLRAALTQAGEQLARRGDEARRGEMAERVHATREAQTGPVIYVRAGAILVIR